uniref:Transposase IS4-like domain-containing protein n=1 Tax=viral metagenome TaxID=1070528 RepID=A0A6C0CAK5_9ZZZZ
MDARFSKIYGKILEKKGNMNLVDLNEEIIIKAESDKNKKYIRNQKYTIKDYICGIIQVLNNNISWRKYNGKIDGRILNNKHNYHCKIGVYEELYKKNLDEYLKKGKEEKLKILSIGSTFIENKNGIDGTRRNINYKNKRGRKITAVVDTKGVPIIMDVSEGNVHDCKLFDKAFDRLKKSKKINRTTKSKKKRYFLADKGYDSEKIRSNVKEIKYDPIIPKRKRKGVKSSLKKGEIKIYRKRTIVENSFSWLKRYAKIDRIYEKKKKSWEGLLLMATSIIIFNKR